MVYAIAFVRRVFHFPFFMSLLVSFGRSVLFLCCEVFFYMYRVRRLYIFHYVLDSTCLQVGLVRFDLLLHSFRDTGASPVTLKSADAGTTRRPPAVDARYPLACARLVAARVYRQDAADAAD